MHTLSFYKCFLKWIFNYLRDRLHFVQIHSNIFNLSIKIFGVPQQYFLGPGLVNLCVPDKTNILPESQCIQHGVDSTIYRSCEVKTLKNFSSKVENNLHAIKQCSQNTNLVFDSKKTNLMLFSTFKMLQYHPCRE